MRESAVDAAKRAHLAPGEQGFETGEVRFLVERLSPVNDVLRRPNHRC